MFDLVPLAGTRRKVPHMDGQTQLIAQFSQDHFPKPNPHSIATPTIGRYQ
jgi:hypothetical protein